MTVALASELILDHRDAYHEEARAVEELSSSRPPVLFDYESASWKEADAAMLGLNLTAIMVRILGHPDGYGQAFPWRQALWRLRHECRSSHLGHTDRDVFEGSLCQRLVYLVVVYDYSPDMAAWQLGVDPARSMRLLEEALRWIERSIDREQERLEAKTKMLDHQASEVLLSRFDREHNDERERLAWEWLIAAGYALAPWGVEQARRRAEHQLHGCPRCRVDAA
jgi:hypothetical protein